MQLTNISTCETNEPEDPVSEDTDVESDSRLDEGDSLQPGPSSSKINNEPEAIEVITPSKYLNECSPIPKIPVPLYKRGKQNSEKLLTLRKLRSKHQTNLKNTTKNQFLISQEFDESDFDQTESDKGNTQSRECFDDYASTKSTAD
ncbi:unnamed protein product [Leptosia nina]|uniref:Exophilin 5 n=1 Tax=Leptosia nina TaxID=320188 RepID=A0AAV1JUI1_9NEOP